MDVLSNSFCAGGGVLGNGTWLNLGMCALPNRPGHFARLLTFTIQGGNQGVTYGGNTSESQAGGGPFNDWDGGKSSVYSGSREILVLITS